MSGASCAKCGREHAAGCKGHRSKNHATDPGGPCGKPPMHGQDVCDAHGGLAPQNRAAGQRRHTEAAAAKVMRRFGGPIDTTPTEALLDAVKWTAGYVAWLRDKVAGIRSDNQLVWGITRTKTGGEDRETIRTAGLSPWVELLGQWHDRLVKICAEAIRAGIEERRVRFAEQQGIQIADVIKAILADLDLSPEQVARVGDVVPAHLRRLMHAVA